jgi:outer membrane lipoprotein-sorting protein
MGLGLNSKVIIQGMACYAPAIAFLIVIGMLLSGCSQAGDPGAATLKYLEARAAANVDDIRAVSCAAWEGQAAAQADSFRSMNAKLENVTCKANGTQGNFTLVTCDGQIVTTYNGENRSRPIPVYQLTQEDGEWKVCGEGEASTP